MSTTTEVRTDGRTLAQRFKTWACFVDVYAVDHGNGVRMDAIVEMNENVYEFPSTKEARELADALVMAAAYVDYVNGDDKR